jgi:antitoxin HicB
VRQFTYAVKLSPDKRDGGYVVTCRDLPEAITQGESIEDALAEAADALEEAIAGRIDDGREIPAPTAKKRGERIVSVPPSMALKAKIRSH